MNKVLSFDKYIGESNEREISYYLKDYIKEKTEIGKKAKELFNKKYKYLVTDIELLLKAMGKAPMNTLLALYNDVFHDDNDNIVENRTKEAIEHIDESGISPIELLCNVGDYDYNDEYIMVISNVVVSFNAKNSPLRNEGFLTWFLYDVLTGIDMDAYNICFHLDFDETLSKEENLKRMTKWFCTEEMANIVLEIYRKYSENEK